MKTSFCLSGEVRLLRRSLIPNATTTLLTSPSLQNAPRNDEGGGFVQKSRRKSLGDDLHHILSSLRASV